MKILIQYLRPFKWLVILVMVLASINIGFSLIDPILLGKLIDLATRHQGSTKPPQSLLEKGDFFNSFSWEKPGVWFILILSVSVAMISRVAKAFQDYFLNFVTQKFGATVFTEGLQHAMKLPYQQFEDQRSGETLSILTKVRSDVEKFMINFINILFGVIIGIVFVFVYAAIFIHWSIPVA